MPLPMSCHAPMPIRHMSVALLAVGFHVQFPSSPFIPNPHPVRTSLYPAHFYSISKVRDPRHVDHMFHGQPCRLLPRHGPPAPHPTMGPIFPSTPLWRTYVHTVDSNTPHTPPCFVGLSFSSRFIGPPQIYLYIRLVYFRPSFRMSRPLRHTAIFRTHTTTLGCSIHISPHHVDALPRWAQPLYLYSVALFSRRCASAYHIAAGRLGTRVPFSWIQE
ncbi:hypothetical protein BV25DRAFT_184755 [Artomyces pyxidatus]|uniref:Uncharacterized protein n=1 Tax=Artomyces pyxidatus TaxID=48021 RepID=A0ACB8T7A5_9AGAM|nr:hypothetical protein BV25DRAFT_184755 [Artomyces pyxidatus]